MATWQDAVGYVADFALGALDGDLAAIVTLSLVALLVIKVVLPGAVFRFLMRTAVLGTMGVATYLGYLHADANFGLPVAVVVAVVGGLMVLFALGIMAANTQQEHRGHAALDSGQHVAGGFLQDSGKLPPRTVGRMVTEGRSQTGAPISSGQAHEPGAASAGHGERGLLAQVRTQLDPAQQNNIFSVIAFMFIAEFGVFSSVTITAQDALVGAIFFVVFHLAAVLYIGTSYQNPKKGLQHYAVVAVASVVVALLLYYTWSVDTVPPSRIFPWSFFVEPTMVASVTGVAFSLIISGKG